MNQWIITITEGPLKGQSFPLELGLTLGRKGARVNLQDGKASSIHATIEKRGGRWTLSDNQSRNGTKVNGKKISTLDLTPNTTFQIGNTYFLVQDPKATSSLDSSFSESSIVLPPVPIANRTHDKSTLSFQDIEAPESRSELIQLEPQDWPEALLSLIGSLPLNRPHHMPLSGFLNPIKLSIFRGIQIGTSWTLGYGPREFGSQSLEFPLYEEGIPASAFTLVPSPQGITFTTNHPNKVFLNGQPHSSELIKSGDIIQVGQTSIEVNIKL